MAAGVSGSSIGGQLSYSNTQIVDGVANTGVWTPTAAASFSLETVQEFQVITNQFPAEYGWASGGVVNVLTRSGTNEFRGRGFLFHRADALDARAAFATGKAPYDQKQFGGFAGGPLRKDRFFYFTNYEGSRTSGTAIVTAPLEPGEYPTKSLSDRALAKFDHHINANHNLTVRWNYNRSTSANGGMGGTTAWSRGYESEGWTNQLAVLENAMLSPRVLNEFRFLFYRSSSATVPHVSTGPELNFPSSSIGKSYAYPTWDNERAIQFVNNLSIHVPDRWGEHNIKLGADIRFGHLVGEHRNQGDGRFYFPKDYFDAKDPTTYPSRYVERVGPDGFDVSQDGYAFFVQDAWRPLRNLSFNLGLRYQYQVYAAEYGAPFNNTSIPVPRLSFAYDPFRTGKTSIRGGYGIFHDLMDLNQWLIIVLNTINAENFIVITNPGYPDPYAGGSIAVPPPSIEEFDPNFSNPYAQHFSLGFEREIIRNLSVSVDAVYSHGLNRIRRRDLNAPPDGTRVRPNPKIERYSWHESSGESKYYALLTNVEKRFAQGFTLHGAYTLASNWADTAARNSTVLPTNHFNLKADWAPSGATHTVNVGGTWRLPYGLQLAGLVQADSGGRFDIVSGRDTNNDGRGGDRPDLDPAGIYPTNGDTTYGRFSIPVNRPGNLQRNYGHSPGSLVVDVRLSKVFRFNRYRAEVLAEAFNVENRLNLSSPVGTITSAYFNQSRSAGSPRRVQLGVRFDF